LRMYLAALAVVYLSAVTNPVQAAPVPRLEATVASRCLNTIQKVIDANGNHPGTTDLGLCGKLVVKDAVTITSVPKDGGGEKRACRTTASSDWLYQFSVTTCVLWRFEGGKITYYQNPPDVMVVRGAYLLVEGSEAHTYLTSLDLTSGSAVSTTTFGQYLPGFPPIRVKSFTVTQQIQFFGDGTWK
jgi:hypothetical protein